MIDQDLLNEIMQDTSFNGKYCRLYEMLQDELDNYSDSRIEQMKDTLKFVRPYLSSKIDSYDKMKVLYEYSNLI
ncbi:hypothetical protein [Flavobacterium sp.]|uniref:hypothetical protein n=1 Tax=Flavobacterium sp. TaxID=239 RepID=UPI0025CE7F80|nr:hypothetical protein [Flavobacterium sp.]